MNRNEKRNLLKQRIFDAAFRRIEKNGLIGLRARDIAIEADCSLGSLYNAYTDLDDLILNVNSHILMMLSESIGQQPAENLDPEENLRLLAQRYMNFAYDNYNLWTSLFTHTMHDNTPIPDWYLDRTNETFSKVIAPLLRLRPDLEQEEVSQMVRTLFSAVHGIIAINLQERFMSISRGALEEQLQNFVSIYAKGLTVET
ncbi:TetR/AcrR family transcriptional regulator [Lentilitoribacter sp. Alg239-R112]|uniref:TetR/AcrR family transcriptional regulator n=1 Tax=Lentilitoribacter sp. Alg239-R112 TaxID=2305987 RepID=UPI0013A6B605|nr:TetR/AcrR family transcriptional regulator [Lentilitoribacter sp. Alg239-R112]